MFVRKPVSSELRLWYKPSLNCGNMLSEYLMKFSFLKVTLVILLLNVTGCKFMPSRNAGDSHARNPITDMPRVTMTDLDAAGRRLVSQGLKVIVRRPSFEITAGRKYGGTPFSIPELVRPFEPSRWNHLVAAQAPPPGTPLRADSIITLTAGVHHGAGPFRAWVDAHPASVKVRGEQRCRECHPPAYCSNCHLKLHPR